MINYGCVGGVHFDERNHFVTQSLISQQPVTPGLAAEFRKNNKNKIPYSMYKKMKNQESYNSKSNSKVLYKPQYIFMENNNKVSKVNMPYAVLIMIFQQTG